MDAEHTPVIAAVGQSIERDEIVDSVEVAARASESALRAAPRLRDRIDRVSMISVVFSPTSPAAGSDLGRRLKELIEAEFPQRLKGRRVSMAALAPTSLARGLFVS